MSIITAASQASLWRGYEYYTEKKVKSFTKISDNEYEGIVDGNGAEPYQVKINAVHTQQSKCNCPHADGKRIICKHMVALYFTAFPSEADEYIKRVEECEREEEQRELERLEEIKEYVNSLTKAELRHERTNYILESENNRYY